MSHSCCNHTPEYDGSTGPFRRLLWWVIALNGVMFLVEMIGGGAADSQALKADALDFLADTATYSLSLAVIGRPLYIRNRAAKFKAISLLAIGASVLGVTILACITQPLPDARMMGGIGFLALLANLASVLLLLKFRHGDANIRSAWLCSRNDAIGNCVVMLAALGVFGTGTGWPDIIVGLIMSGLFLQSAGQIFRQLKSQNTPA